MSQGKKSKKEILAELERIMEEFREVIPKDFSNSENEEPRDKAHSHTLSNNISEGLSDYQLYKDLVESVSDVIYRTDENGILKFVSSSCERFLGYKPEELVGNRFVNYIVDDDLSFILSQYKKIAAGGMVPSEYRLKTKSGESKYVRSSSRGVFVNGRFRGLTGIIIDISKQKETEDLLHKQQIRSNLIFTNASDILVVIKPDGKQEFVSRSVEKILGFSAEELEGKNLSEIIHPDDLPRVMEEWQKNIGIPQSIVTIQYRHLHKNGNWVELEAVAQNFTHDPLIGGVISSVRDISERKRIDKILRENTEIYKGVMSSMMDGFWRLDLRGNIKEVNEAACKLIGYSREELLSMNISDIEVEETKSEIDEQISKIIISKSRRFEAKHRHKIGDIVDVEINVTYSPLADGELFAFIRDITVRKKYEKKLKESENTYRSVIHTSLSGFWRIDIQGRILEVNQAWCDMSGYTMEEMKNKTIMEIEACESIEETEIHIQKTINEGSSRFETKHKCKDGTIIDVEINATYSIYAGDQFFAFINDISERKRNERLITEKLEELEKFNSFMIGRENRMIELKNEVNELLVQAGFPKKYSVPENN